MAGTRFAYVRSFELPDPLLPNTFIVVRIDGHAFHRFSEVHQYEKPNDPRGINLMNAAARSLMESYPDIVLGFGESDEFSFLLRRACDLFNRRHSKILTSLVSHFTSSFVFQWSRQFPETPLAYPPSFDGRIVLYPTEKEVRDYFSWRQADTHINNLYNTTFWALVQQGGLSTTDAHKRLKGTFSKDKNEILFSQFGVNYNHLPAMYRKGSILLRQRVENGLASTTNDLVPTTFSEDTTGGQPGVISQIGNIPDVHGAPISDITPRHMESAGAAIDRLEGQADNPRVDRVSSAGGTFDKRPLNMGMAEETGGNDGDERTQKHPSEQRYGTSAEVTRPQISFGERDEMNGGGDKAKTGLRAASPEYGPMTARSTSPEPDRKGDGCQDSPSDSAPNLPLSKDNLTALGDVEKPSIEATPTVQRRDVDKSREDESRPPRVAPSASAASTPASHQPPLLSSGSEPPEGANRLSELGPEHSGVWGPAITTQAPRLDTEHSISGPGPYSGVEILVGTTHSGVYSDDERNEPTFVTYPSPLPLSVAHDQQVGNTFDHAINPLPSSSPRDEIYDQNEKVGGPSGAAPPVHDNSVSPLPTPAVARTTAPDIPSSSLFSGGASTPTPTQLPCDRAGGDLPSAISPKMRDHAHSHLDVAPSEHAQPPPPFRKEEAPQEINNVNDQIGDGDRPATANIETEAEQELRQPAFLPQPPRAHFAKDPVATASSASSPPPPSPPHTHAHGILTLTAFGVPGEIERGGAPRASSAPFMNDNATTSAAATPAPPGPDSGPVGSRIIIHAADAPSDSNASFRALATREEQDAVRTSIADAETSGSNCQPPHQSQKQGKIKTGWKEKKAARKSKGLGQGQADSMTSVVIAIHHKDLIGDAFWVEHGQSILG